MDEQPLARWGTLHQRRVTGETLDATERSEYELGCQELDAEEKLNGDLPRLWELHARIDAVMQTQQRLQEQEDALTSRIAALEDRLEEWARQRQRVGNCAAWRTQNIRKFASAMTVAAAIAACRKPARAVS